MLARRFSTPAEGRLLYEWLLGRNDVFGRYVRVQLEGTDFLQVAELEVFVVDEAQRCAGPVSPGLTHDPECIEVPVPTSAGAVGKRCQMMRRVLWVCMFSTDATNQETA